MGDRLSSDAPQAMLRRTRKARLRLGLIWACLLVAQPMPAQEVEEYEFKAAFLYNLAKFVEWPMRAFEHQDDPIRACVLGESPLGSALKHVPAGNVVGDRKFLVKRISQVSDSSACHILFVSASERKHWPIILENSRKSWTLTVGEEEGFASSGGIINFKMDRDRVRIQVNVEAARRENLQISSRLLSLSQIVKEETR